MSLVLAPGKLSHEPAVGYTPESDVDAYTVQVVGDHPYVANLAIPAGKRGSLSPRGGTYIATTNGTDPSPGQQLLFAPGAGGGTLLPITESPGAGTYKHFGRVAPGSAIVDNGGGSFTYEVEHDPNGNFITFGS
jgi:hypothetical protein